MAFRPELIKKLSKKDWESILRSQGLSADNVAWAFRESNEKKYQKRIPALYELCKEQ